MPITSVESSAYVQQQQQQLADYKVGQYAKFLEKNPIYVTYYAINHARSTADAGTGDSYENIGPKSPVRYNKILNLPVFNVPQITPDVNVDEAGYETVHDISDITFIPGTVRPRPGDCLRFDFANTKPLLYQCTDYGHNSIQSNDYYLGDFSLYDVDDTYIRWIEDQVVETYTCNFEAIGTNQKVFVTQADMEATSELQSMIDELLDFYKNAFYNEAVDGFILYGGGSGILPGSDWWFGYQNGQVGIGDKVEPYYGNVFGTQWYYDNYLTKFINESRIFQNDKSDYTLILPYLDLTPPGFDTQFLRTMWSVVLKRDPDYLHMYTFCWNSWIHNRTSPLVLGSFPCITPNLHMASRFIKVDEPPTHEMMNAFGWMPGKHCGWDGVEPAIRTYFSWPLLKSIKENVRSDELNYVERMIFDYIYGGAKSVIFNKSELLEVAFRADYFTYMHLPIVIYILKQKLNAMNSKEESSI